MKESKKTRRFFTGNCVRCGRCICPEKVFEFSKGLMVNSYKRPRV